MNYYKHHIGDYARDTAHLTMLEDAAYRRMLDLYYASEKPLPRLDALCRLIRARSKDERKAVEQVLSEFFHEQPDGWHQGRCDSELVAMQEKAGTNRDNGKKGGRPKKKPKANPQKTQPVSDSNPNETLPTTHYPLPTTHSVPIGTGGKPPTDPVKAEIWKTGRALLEGQGESESAAGTFLGKLCKDYGNLLVVEAVRDAAHATPAEAKAWLVARCQERRAASGNKATAIETRNAEAVKQAMKEAGHA